MREYDINLIPNDVLESETLILRARSWLLIAAGVLILLFVINMTIKIINNYVSKEISALSSASEKFSREMMQTRDIRLKEQELLNIREKIGFLSQKGPIMRVFSTIDKAINHNITLTHIEMRSQYPSLQKSMQKSMNDGAGGSNSYFRNSMPVKESGGKDNTIVIHGMAQSNSDVATMLLELSKNEFYESVNLRYSRLGDSEQGRSVIFEMECSLKNLN